MPERNPHIIPDNQLHPVTVQAYISEAMRRDGFYSAVAHGLPPQDTAEVIAKHMVRMKQEHGTYSVQEHGTGMLPPIETVAKIHQGLINEVGNVATTGIEVVNIKPPIPYKTSYLN